MGKKLGGLRTGPSSYRFIIMLSAEYTGWSATTLHTHSHAHTFKHTHPHTHMHILVKAIALSAITNMALNSRTNMSFGESY